MNTPDGKPSFIELGVDIYVIAERTVGKLGFRGEFCFDDMVQEAVMEMIRRVGDYNPERSSADTFLSLMARRGAVDEYRREEISNGRNPRSGHPSKNDKGVVFSIDDLVSDNSEHTFDELIEDRGSSPEQRLVEKLDEERQAQTLQKRLLAIKKMPPRQKQVMVELIGGLSIKETALKLKISRNTVDSHLHNAREFLRLEDTE